MKTLCAWCPIRRFAQRRPASLLARMWRWHIGWCPGWKKYRKDQLAELCGKDCGCGKR